MQPQATVLIVDDDSDLRRLVAESLESRGFVVAQASDVADALTRLEGFAYDALVIDLRLPDGDGMDVLGSALARYPEIVSVVMTGAGGVPDAVEAIKRGAIDFLTKPFLLSHLGQLLERSLDRSPAVEPPSASDAEPRPRYGRIIGSSRELQRIFAMIDRVAMMNSTVLIHGETGTGKELIARTIHEHSSRRQQPFVAFNAAAMPEGLVEAELFGHVKGAFTGAVASRVGRFESAHKGTLFIDEVASMSLSVQAKLLRALQEREIERVGESKTFKFDIRLIAATNTDLRKLVKEGTFREDLFYRLNVVPLMLPPLRARRDDIPLLAQHFVKQSCRMNGLGPRTITQAALRALMDYAWPGNIRQLENAVEHAVAMTGAQTEIVPAALPAEVVNPDRATLLPAVTIPDAGINFISVVSQLERDLITQCLERTGGNKRQAARLLNLSRTTLIDKLHRLGTPTADAEGLPVS
jgi:DNA-binding NtrC family response regulator